jgi:class 3 adenylate cyclase/tetratricopeptide (TPR) repeat protein
VPATASNEERRVVSILFVDLVGFTERSDNADPEDVRRTLVPFHATVKRDLERFGGTLDKFIGDAVMGVFGAPVAHDDDPERAVRAALAVLDSIAELKRVDPAIAVRVAVNTGEAVVTFGSGPQIGEAVAGDVVNTASRMQAVADRDGVVVGDSTRRSCRDLFEFEEMPPFAVKGKAEPLRVWRVLGERLGGAATAGPGFVGRARELGQLLELYRGVEGDRSGRVVTVVAEPGVGKTRLVAEFRRSLGDAATWLAGRCAPYGEGVTFRAMADVVRSQAGIVPPDDAEVSGSKLRAMVAAIEPSAAERDWLTRRLEPLLGLVGDESDGSPVSAPESAAAWSRLVEAKARLGPVVVCFEDLHWAEPVLLEMVGHAAVELERHRVMLLLTTRPTASDGLDRWDAGLERTTTLLLSELTKDETSTLLDEALTLTVLPRHVRDAVLGRAGGNPLFALEFVRMLSEAGRDVGGSGIPVPESVHAVIATRLDTIPADLRALVHDASVVGTTFWPGALAALSGLSEPEVLDAIGRLGQRDLIRAEAASSFVDQPEFAFAHALIREVAYARMPRLVRAQKHRAAGEWLERQAADRSPEWADALANHFQQAATLARLAGAIDEFERGRGPAVRWSLEAADRAVRLDQPGAFLLYDQALELEEARTPQRAKALMGSGLMGRRTGRLPAADVLLRFEEAREIEEELEDPLRVGNALVQIGSQLGAMGETARSRAALQRAVDVLEAEPPSRELARACAFIAEEDMFGGRVRESLAWSERALGLAHDFGADDVAIMALHIRGDARCSLGEHEGIRDLEEALELSDARGNAADSVTSENYLAEWRWALDGPRDALAHDERALALAERRGVVSQGLWTKAHGVWLLFELGEWDRQLRWCDELLATGGDRLDRSLYVVASLARARVLLLLGREDEASPPVDILSLARPMDEMQVLVPALVVASEFADATGDRDTVLMLLAEFEEVTRDVAAEYRESHLTGIVRRCISAGARDLAERLVEQSHGRTKRDRLNVNAARAALDEAAGGIDEATAGYLTAESAWEGYEYPLERAFATAGAARCLASLGRDDESRAASDRSASTFDALGVVASLRT